MFSDRVEIKKKKTFLQRKREAMQVKKTTMRGETSSDIDNVRHKVKESAMEPSTESSTNQEDHTTTPKKENKPIEKDEPKTSLHSPIASTSKTETMQRIKSPIKVKGLSDLPKLEPITKSSSKESNKSETRGRKNSVSNKQPKPKEELKKKQSIAEEPENVKPPNKTGQVESKRKLFESKASSSQSTESTKDSFQAVSKAASSQLQSVSKTRPKPPRTSKLQPQRAEKTVAKPERLASKNESKESVQVKRPELQRSVTMEIVETESEEEEKEMAEEEEESDDNSEEETEEDSRQSSENSEEVNNKNIMSKK